MGLNNEDIHIIKAKTEGWISDLQLIAKLLQGKSHVSNLLLKLDAKNRNQAIGKAKEIGIV